MTRPNIFERPLDWAITSRTTENEVDKSCPLHIVRARPMSLGERVCAVIGCTIIGVLLAMALVHWWTS